MRIQKLCSLIFIMIPTLSAFTENANGDEGEWKIGLYGQVGYKNIDGIAYEHETHPDDAIFMTGSPGSTSVDNAFLLALGLRVKRTNTFGLPLEFTADAGGLLSLAKDRHQNNNDSRPKSQGSFVYSKVSPFGMETRIGTLFYPFQDIPLGFGGEATLSVFRTEHGWDRFGKDEKAQSKWHYAFTAGPKVGLNIFDHLFLELAYGHGLNSINSHSADLRLGVEF